MPRRPTFYPEMLQRLSQFRHQKTSVYSWNHSTVMSKPVVVSCCSANSYFSKHPDLRLRERQAERDHLNRQVTHDTPEEPMQVGHSKLSAEERRKRRDEGLCFYCGNPGHKVNQCNSHLKLPDPSLDSNLTGNDSTRPDGDNFFFAPVKICHQAKIHEFKALIDSGAEQCLIDQQLVNQYSLPTELLVSPIKAAGLGGQHLSRITHRTKPLLFITSGNHREYLQFFITQTPQTPIVLGFSWLKRHNPQIDWLNTRISHWSTFCLANCLHSAVPTVSPIVPNITETADLSKIPPCYHDLKLVFCKTKASALPPHRPYDCAINLINDITLPKGKLYNLSGPEKKAMEDYIHEALALGHIRPSSSPVGAGLFFVEKKDKTLRPCIDYRELNQITVKDKYSLPLINTVFDSIQEASIFSKLDLRNAYHLVRIREGDEWKTAFNTPLGHYEYQVMPFGLTNAPAIFQRLVNDVLRDFLNRFVFVYLDDILIYSCDLAQHKH
uniref:ribonuclease H n=1 Tax=Oryzias sinensis TaxID=183150 RepID=A0A8C7YUC9_9TELE